MFTLAFRPSFVILYVLWEHGGVYIADNKPRESVQDGVQDGVQESVQDGVQDGVQESAQESAQESVQEGEWMTDPHMAFSAEVTWVARTDDVPPTDPKRIPIPTMHRLASKPRTPWMTAWIQEMTRAMLEYPSIDFYFEENRALMKRYHAEWLTTDLHENAVRLAAMVATVDRHRASYKKR